LSTSDAAMQQEAEEEISLNSIKATAEAERANSMQKNEKGLLYMQLKRWILGKK
jgi:hypothetical protein